MAPDFTIQDSERKVTLSDFRGKVVLLNFWASYCIPCLEEIPSLVQLQQRMQNKGVVVLAVSWDEDIDLYHKFLRDHNVNFITVMESDRKTGTMYGTEKIPETYVIDRNGKIQRKFISAVDWGDPEIVNFLNKL